MQILFLRDDDIPQYVEDAVADIGIVGENIILEKNTSVRFKLEKLPQMSSQQQAVYNKWFRIN